LTVFGTRVRREAIDVTPRGSAIERTVTVQRRWIAFTVTSAIYLGIGLALLTPMLHFIVYGVWASDQPVGFGNYAMAVAVLALGALFLSLPPLMLPGLLVTVGEDGLRQRRLRIVTFIPWDTVKSVRLMRAKHSDIYFIISANTSIPILLEYFTNPEELVAGIRDHVRRAGGQLDE
jgi:hypothetical protein